MVISEKELQTKLILLGAYANVNFIQEYTVEALENSRTATRRFDLVQVVDKEVRIIELKKSTVTLNDIAVVLGVRGYGELARRSFPGKEVGVYFMSPRSLGIQSDALNLLRETPTSKYIPIEDLGRAIFDVYVDRLPLKGKWKAKEVYAEFNTIIGPVDYLSNKEFC